MYQAELLSAWVRKRCGEEYLWKPLEVYKMWMRNKLSYLKSRKNWYVFVVTQSWLVYIPSKWGTKIPAKPFWFLSLNFELCHIAFLDVLFVCLFLMNAHSFINILSLLRKYFHRFSWGDILSCLVLIFREQWLGVILPNFSKGQFWRWV